MVEEKLFVPQLLKKLYDDIIVENIIDKPKS